MTVVEHLDELRYRILVSLGAIAVGTIVGYIFYESVLAFLTRPLDQDFSISGVQVKDVPLYVSGITGPFLLRLKVSVFAGVFLALPVTLYQLWRFITPGLEPNEKRYAIPFVTASVGLFLLGAWFAFLVLPTGIRFLLGFVASGQQPLLLFPDYLGFIIVMILAFGVTFEFPLVLVSLAGVGILSSSKLRGWRRYAILIIFAIAAVATPSQDPFSQLAMALPLYLLFEASILVIRFGLKK